MPSHRVERLLPNAQPARRRRCVQATFLVRKAASLVPRAGWELAVRVARQMALQVRRTTAIQIGARDTDDRHARANRASSATDVSGSPRLLHVIQWHGGDHCAGGICSFIFAIRRDIVVPSSTHRALANSTGTSRTRTLNSVHEPVSHCTTRRVASVNRSDHLRG